MERKYKSDFQVKLAHHFAYAPVEALHGQVRKCNFSEACMIHSSQRCGTVMYFKERKKQIVCFKLLCGILEEEL